MLADHGFRLECFSLEEIVGFEVFDQQWCKLERIQKCE
jgi:hypothetical protein